MMMMGLRCICIDDDHMNYMTSWFLDAMLVVAIIFPNPLVKLCTYIYSRLIKSFAHPGRLLPNIKSNFYVYIHRTYIGRC